MLIRKLFSDNKSDLRKFINFTRDLYAEDSLWVQPLDREIKRKLDPHINPFFQYGYIQPFGVFDANRRLLGRTVAVVNPWHMRLHGEAVGFFGLFECVNDKEVAQKLMDGIKAYLRFFGHNLILGPVNFSMNYESGFLLEGYDFPPTFMCNYCKPYYHELIKSCGLDKIMDTLSYETYHGHKFPDKYYKVIKYVSKNNSISIRRLNKKSIKEDIRIICDVYNKSFFPTWGFVPLSEGEADELASGLMAFADFNLVWIAHYDNKPVGFILGFPDFNEILIQLKGKIGLRGLLRILATRKSIKNMRIAGFGVLPEFRSLGIETLLIHKVHNRINTRPYKRIEFSVVLENNLRMRQMLEAFGFSISRRYRIYYGEI